MKRVLVTGGPVFVSKWIAEHFVAMGEEVYVLNRNHRKQPEGVKLIQCDRHQIGDALKNLEFDVVVDTGYTAEDVELLLDALGGCQDYIFISSSAVYPEYETQPFTEETPAAGNRYWAKYGKDKIEAEQVLLRRKPDAYILRPPYLYGSMNDIYREAFVFDCAMEGRKFYLPQDGEMQLQFFHIQDLCRFIDILLEKKPAQHIFNVGNEGSISIREWVTLCYEAVGKQAEFINVYEDVEQRNYFSFCEYEYRLDVSKQKEWMPTTKPMREGLLEAFAWYQENREEVERRPFQEYIDKNLKTELAIATDFHGEGKSLEEIKETLRQISDAGFSHIHWCHDWDGDYLYSVYEMEQFKEWLDAYHLRVKGIHATKGTKRDVTRSALHARRDYTSDWECSRKAGVELIQNRVELAAYLGAKEIVLHLYPPFVSIERGTTSRESFYANVKKSFDELYPFCMENGVRICVENLFDMPGEYVEELWNWLMETYPAEYIGFCFDSGHANMIWGDRMTEMLHKYRDRIFAVHLHDNFGAVDYHMIPGEGAIGWDDVMRELKESAYELPLILELESGQENTKEYLKRAYRAGCRLQSMCRRERKCEE